MRLLSRSWDGMSQPERIVAMSLVTGGVVAIVNSTVWAVAVCFMSAQRTRVRLAEAQARASKYTTAQPSGLATSTSDQVEAVMAATQMREAQR